MGRGGERRGEERRGEREFLSQQIIILSYISYPRFLTLTIP